MWVGPAMLAMAFALETLGPESPTGSAAARAPAKAPMPALLEVAGRRNWPAALYMS